MKFILWGGFGGVNLGDDLILYSTLRDLQFLMPDVEIRVLVSGANLSPLGSFREEEKVQMLPDTLHNRIDSFRKGYQLFIPGGQVIDEENRFFPLGKLASESVLHLLFNRKRSVLTAIGVRPIHKRLHRFYLLLLRSSVRSVLVRDTLSLEEIRRILPYKTTQTLPDAVLANRALWTIKESWSPSSQPPKVLVVQGIEKSRHAHSDTMTRLNSFLRAFEVDSLPCILQHDFRYDLDAEDCKVLHNIEVSSLDAPSSIEETQALYTHYDIVFSNRLHAVILGLITGALVYLDEAHPKLLAIHKMGLELTQVTYTGITFYKLSDEGQTDLRNLRKLRLATLEKVLLHE